MESPAEEVEILDRRIEFLERLLETPLHKADLVEELGTSRSTVNRAIRELEAAGFVERIAEGYVTTHAGRLAAERYRAFLADVRSVLDARPVLAALDRDREVPAALLSDATTGSTGDAYALFETLAERLGSAAEYRAVVPRIVDSRHLRACHARVVEGELTATLVTSTDELERLGEEFPHLTGELVEAPGFTAKAGPVPRSGVVLFYGEAGAERPDDVLLLGYGDDGVAGFVHSEAPEAAEWAADVVDSVVADAREATAAVDRPESHAALTPMAGDRLPASLRSQGFVQVDDRYFRRREPMSAVSAWRAGLGLPEVAAGYAVERTADDCPGDRLEGDAEGAAASLADQLLDRLEAGDDLALVGPPGSGKSTVCKRVACAWHEADRGPVFYRETGRGEPFDAVGALERTLERTDGEALVVVEDAVRADANAIFELVRAFRGSDGVRFLLDAREGEWHDPEEFPVDARLRAVRREAIEVIPMPSLTKADCRRLLDRFGAETGERPDLPVDELLSEVRRGQAEEDRAAPGGITLLLHRLVRYADPLSSPAGGEPPTSLDEDVARVREDLAGLADLALDVGVLVNLLNAAGVGIYPSYVHALAGEDPDDHATVLDALDRLEGQVLFPADDDAGTPYRTVHETWSVRFLERLLATSGEVATGRRVGRCVTALLALADEPDRREAVARQVGTGAGVLESVVAAPEEWTAETVEAIFALGRTYPKLATLFGTAEESAIELPAACPELVAARCTEWRGRMYEAAGAFDRAERAFERLAERTGDLPAAEARALRMASLLGRSDVNRKRGDLEAAAGHAQECLALAEAAEDREWQAEARRRLGVTEWRRGNYGRAREYSERSLETARELGARKLEAKTLNNLGVIAWEQDAYDSAREYYRASVDIARELGDRREEARGHNNLGTVAHQRGDLDAAHEHFQRSLAVKRELGDRPGEASTLNNLGIVAETLGEYDEAREYHERSLAVKRELGDRPGEAHSLLNLGAIAYRRGRYDRAREYFERCLDISRDHGDRRAEAGGHTNMGLVAFRRGDHERAREHLRRGLELAEELGTPNEELRSRWALGMLARQRGEYDRASTHLEAAMDRREEEGDPILFAQLSLERARLALAHGEVTTARERARRAHEAAAEVDANHWVGRSRKLLGRVAARDGDTAEALDHWQAALETFEAVGAPQDALATLEYLVETGHGAGDERVREWCRRAEDVLAGAPEPVAVEHEEWVVEYANSLDVA